MIPKRQTDQYEGDFSRRKLRKLGFERVIAACSYGGRRYLKIAIAPEGQPPGGGTQIRPEHAPLLERALEVARSNPRGSYPVGEFTDGRFRLEIKCGIHPEGGGAIFLHKSAEGHAGAPIALYGAELEALEAGLAWLTEAL
jgi:hypothetical protein